jgi:hypothetical protein
MSRSGGSTFKRCGCRDPRTGRQLGRRCPRLRERGHGSWYLAVELSALARIRATLRAALNAAIREGLISANPARLVELPAPARPHPVVWTAPRGRLARGRRAARGRGVDRRADCPVPRRDPWRTPLSLLSAHGGVRAAPGRGGRAALVRRRLRRDHADSQPAAAGNQPRAGAAAAQEHRRQPGPGPRSLDPAGPRRPPRPAAAARGVRRVRLRPPGRPSLPARVPDAQVRHAGPPGGTAPDPAPRPQARLPPSPWPAAPTSRRSRPCSATRASS